MMSFSHHVGDQGTNKSYTNDLNLFHDFLISKLIVSFLAAQKHREKNAGVLGSTVKDRYNSSIVSFVSHD